MELSKPQIEVQTARSARNWPGFAVLVAGEMWLAHAIAFFVHEYAHSTTAWLMGWKENPLAINYAHPTLSVFLLQLGISENVDYAPIFAAGRGWQAAIIAAAGMVAGNALITYPLSLWGIRRGMLRGSRAWAMLFYWLCAASVGNFIDYVPVRTFANQDDMHTLARGSGHLAVVDPVRAGRPCRHRPGALSVSNPTSGAALGAAGIRYRPRCSGVPDRGCDLRLLRRRGNVRERSGIAPDVCYLGLRNVSAGDIGGLPGGQAGLFRNSQLIAFVVEHGFTLRPHWGAPTAGKNRG